MDGLGITASGSGPAGREGAAPEGGPGASSTATATSSGRRGQESSSSGSMTRKAQSKGKEPATTYVVSKIDAGQATLLSDQVHCIEFPSILLPPGCTQGSIISISCSRNFTEERARSDEFWDLQDDILASFGESSPVPPSLRLRNVTQTSVTLEWDRLQLATARLLSLTIWRNGQRLAAIPNALNNTSTKVSGLDVDAPYSFHLIVRTTAGTFSSQTIKTRTLTLADTSGVAVCFGAVSPPELLDEAKAALDSMRARYAHRIQIETTHFVCTHAADGPTGPPPGSDAPNPAVEFQRASQLSIPIVHPSWVLACVREKKMVPISAHAVDKAALSGGPPSTASLNRQGSKPGQQQAPGQVPKNVRPPPIQLQQPPRGRSSTAGSVDEAGESQVAAAPAAVAPVAATSEEVTNASAPDATPAEGGTNRGDEPALAVEAAEESAPDDATSAALQAILGKGEASARDADGAGAEEANKDMGDEPSTSGVAGEEPSQPSEPEAAHEPEVTAEPESGTELTDEAAVANLEHDQEHQHELKEEHEQEEAQKDEEVKETVDAGARAEEPEAAGGKGEAGATEASSVDAVRTSMEDVKL